MRPSRFRRSVTTRAYLRFAAYYDTLYRGVVDYDGDVAFLNRLFRRYMHRKPKSLLDLGCGTGNHDLPLLRRGFDVTGLDASGPMLAVARRKARAARLPLRLVRGDMRSFNLGRSFDGGLHVRSFRVPSDGSKRRGMPAIRSSSSCE